MVLIREAGVTRSLEVHKVDQGGVCSAPVFNVREYAKRSLVPSAAISVLESMLSTRVRAGIVRVAKLRVRAELYFAFDDPYSAIAFAEVAELAEERSVDLSLFPILDRGVPGESNDDQRRRYAVVDARRLARRRQRRLSRNAPVARNEISNLTMWAEAARERGKLEEFSGEVFDRLWFRNEVGVDFGEAYAIYGRIVGGTPPRNLTKYRARVAANSGRLRQRGHWDAPALWVEGKWFFAHERLEQAADYMSQLGAR
jgi:2-hydroxychromene-2-carboxylate isomerase